MANRPKYKAIHPTLDNGWSQESKHPHHSANHHNDNHHSSVHHADDLPFDFDPSLFSINENHQLTLNYTSVEAQHLKISEDDINAHIFPLKKIDNPLVSTNAGDAIFELATKYFAFPITSCSCDFLNSITLLKDESISKNFHQPIISNIENHNCGKGSDSEIGVISNTTCSYKIVLRLSNTKNIFRDADNNAVYGRIDYRNDNYELSLYVNINGVETTYSPLENVLVNLECLLFSDKFINIPWKSIAAECSAAIVGVKFIGEIGPQGLAGVDGVSLNWKGPWNIAASYLINDAVEFNGSSYIAIVDNIGFSPDTSPFEWNLLAGKGSDGIIGVDGVSFVWRGSWTAINNYIINDIVEYQGDSFIAVATSNNNIPDNTPAWNLFAQGGKGFVWRGPWSNSVVYTKDDVVEYQESSYIALNTTTAVPIGNPLDWELLAAKGEVGSGFFWRGIWAPTTSYAIDDVVEYLGSSYIALAINSGITPNNNPLNWELVAQSGQGFTWAGVWNNSITYSLDLVVEYLGSSYIALTSNTGSIPVSNPLDWELVAAKGDKGDSTEFEKILTQPNALVVFNAGPRWYPKFDIEIISISANVSNPPQGSDIIVDINKNSASTIINPAKITIPVNTNAIFNVVPDVVNLLADTDYITIDIDQVGSTVPGSNLNVQILYRRV